MDVRYGGNKGGQGMVMIKCVKSYNASDDDYDDGDDDDDDE